MNRSHETFEKRLRRLIGRSRHPSPERMDSAIDNVWQRLHSEILPPQMEGPLEPAAVRPNRTFQQIRLAAVLAAVVLFAVLSMPLLRGLIAPDNVYAVVETVQGSVYRVTDGVPRTVDVGERLNADTPLR